MIWAMFSSNLSLHMPRERDVLLDSVLVASSFSLCTSTVGKVFKTKQGQDLTLIWILLWLTEGSVQSLQKHRSRPREKYRGFSWGCDSWLEQRELMARKRISVYSGMKLNAESQKSQSWQLHQGWVGSGAERKSMLSGEQQELNAGLEGIDRVCSELGEEQMGCDCQPTG